MYVVIGYLGRSLVVLHNQGLQFSFGQLLVVSQDFQKSQRLLLVVLEHQSELWGFWYKEHSNDLTNARDEDDR